MIIAQKLPSRLESIPQFLEVLIEKIKGSAVLSEEELFNVKLCLEEAIVNAVRHGNKLNPELSVEVIIEAGPDALTLKVINQGEGFDYSKVPDPTKGENFLKTSGRGVFLIKQLMDKVDYFDCGRGIKMIKFLKSKEARREDKSREKK